MSHHLWDVILVNSTCLFKDNYSCYELQQWFKGQIFMISQTRDNTHKNTVETAKIDTFNNFEMHAIFCKLL